MYNEFQIAMKREINFECVALVDMKSLHNQIR